LGRPHPQLPLNEVLGNRSPADPPIRRGSLRCRATHRIDFAEAYLVASAEAAGIPDIISFDRSIDRVTTTNRIEP
jgi:hypothetical protein